MYCQRVSLERICGVFSKLCTLHDTEFNLRNCRKSLRQVVCQPKHESTRSIRVLVLLLESGVLYTIFVVSALCNLVLKHG